MRYQLVVQFRATLLSDYDRLIDLEERLREGLPGSAQVDGHDFGSNEFNIFILTDDPASTFSQIDSILNDQSSRNNMRVAYRALSGDSYTVLWPPDLDEFDLA